MGHLISKTKIKTQVLQLEKLKNKLRKLPIAMLSTTKCDQRDGFILGSNIWLQPGWASPCEVTKNLARLSSLITT